MKNRTEEIKRLNSYRWDTIQEGWDLYTMLLPENCSQEQEIELRRAFYAGANALLKVFNIRKITVLEEQDIQLLNDIQFMVDSYLRIINTEVEKELNPIKETKSLPPPQPD